MIRSRKENNPTKKETKEQELFRLKNTKLLGMDASKSNEILKRISELEKEVTNKKTSSIKKSKLASTEADINYLEKRRNEISDSIQKTIPNIKSINNNSIFKRIKPLSDNTTKEESIAPVIETKKEVKTKPIKTSKTVTTKSTTPSIKTQTLNGDAFGMTDNDILQMEKDFEYDKAHENEFKGLVGPGGGMYQGLNRNKLINLKVNNQTSQPPRQTIRTSSDVYDPIIDATGKTTTIGLLKEAALLGMNLDALNHNNNVQEPEKVGHIAGNTVNIHSVDRYNPAIEDIDKSASEALIVAREGGMPASVPGIYANKMNAIIKANQMQGELDTKAINTTTGINSQNALRVQLANKGFDAADIDRLLKFNTIKGQNNSSIRQGIATNLTGAGMVAANSIMGKANARVNNRMYNDALRTNQLYSLMHP